MIKSQHDNISNGDDVDDYSNTETNNFKINK